jgi:hypothetical protein
MSKRTVGLILFAACPAVAGAQGPGSLSRRTT